MVPLMVNFLGFETRRLIISFIFHYSDEGLQQVDGDSGRAVDADLLQGFPQGRKSCFGPIYFVYDTNIFH